MQYRNCKDVKTSLLGFGCMRFPTTAEGRIDEPAATAMLDAAYAAGVNYYDTAWPYHDGQSESFLGSWLKTKDRASLFVTTKLPCWEIQAPEDMEKVFSQQLQKLGTDYVDFYLVHALEGERWHKMKELGLLPFLDGLKASGRARHIGFSFHDDYPAFEEILKGYPWDICQIQYNYMDRSIQAGDRGYLLAKELGVPMAIMEPVRGGSLANPPEAVRQVLARQGEGSGAAWALRWVADHDNVAVILSGMSTLEQVQENVETLSHAAPLTEAQRAAIDQAAEVYRQRIRVPCTGCRYCMPCPAGVNIPGVFRAYNNSSIYYDGKVKDEYRFLPEESRASVCVACGRCMELCPQHLSIPARMAEIAQWEKA